ncbi:hypothetical protein KR054_005457 [Drosophila jambulina]|nr:hypothetical protein KR054_005457 [Drosophila jambulina]
MDKKSSFPIKFEQADIITIDLTGDDESEESKRLRVPECRLCFDMAKVPVATLCGHIYCMSCLTRALDVCASCPVCRQSSSFIRLYC